MKTEPLQPCVQGGTAITPNRNRVEASSDGLPDTASSKLYFSCPKFTVLLAVRDEVIVKAAPLVKKFEGQTIGALTSWAKTKFGGPVTVERIS